MVPKIIFNWGTEAEYNLAKTTEITKRKTEQRHENLGKEINHEEKNSSSLQLTWAEGIRETENLEFFL